MQSERDGVLSRLVKGRNKTPPEKETAVTSPEEKTAVETLPGTGETVSGGDLPETAKSGHRGTFKRVRDWVDMSFEVHPVISTVALAFLLTMVIEMACRHSPWQGVVFLFTRPLNYFCNMCIIMMTLSLAHFGKKRTFFLTLVSAVWLILGLINAVVLALRVTPFGLIDIKMLPGVFPIIPKYLSWWQIVLIGVAAVAVIAAMVVVWMRCEKHPRRFRMACIFTAASVLLAVGAYSLTVVGRREKRQDDFSNIANAYKIYGFTYCFCTGAIDEGIDQPDFYSRAAVNWLVGNLEEERTPAVLPNIIMVQLESFFDISYLDDVKSAADPIPTFTSIKDRCSSGFLTVPSVGAGTANTEFEVLSGMSLHFFGMGEYPYKTILKEAACETVVRDLKELGYTGTAIHNNDGTFYDRNKVFTQLGFDNFISLEYMQDVEYNPIGWAKDKVLTKEILKALDATGGQDFIFTITVQGHGKYQRGIDSVDMESMGVEWANEDEDDEGAFAYYVSQLQETDQFIADLTAALSRRAEPTVLVLYGDHLPSFSIGSDQLENGDIFETEYAIWSNYELPEHDEDVCAYQLSAKVLEELGISRGMMTRYHQQMSDSEDYLDGLSLLEYDMLYGNMYCFGGSNPYEATDLQMGVEPILVRGYEYDVDTGVLTVKGRNFTAFSVAALDGEECETEFVDSSTLKVTPDDPPFLGQILTVRQNTKQGVTLSESVGIVVK